VRCAVGEGNGSEGDFAIFRGREEQFRRSDKIGDQSDKKCEKRQGRVAVPGASRERNVMDSSCVSRVETVLDSRGGKGRAAAAAVLRQISRFVRVRWWIIQYTLLGAWD